MARVIDQVLGATTSSVVGEITRELVNASDGAGLHFDGAAGSVAFTPVDLGTDFSFEFVIKQDSNTDAYIVDFSGGGTNRFIIGRNGNELQMYSSTSWDTFGVAPLDDGKVHHIVITVSETLNATLYDNGNQIATLTLNANYGLDAATSATFGSRFNAASSFFNGTIYRARVYNRALSADDVRTAYERADVPFADQYGSQTELITNGNFAADSNWSKESGWTISGGKAVCATSSTNAIYQTGVAVGGNKYRVTYTISDYSSGGIYLDSQGGAAVGVAGTDGTLRTSNGTYTEEITIAKGGNLIVFRGQASTTSDLKLDDVSVVRIGAVSDYDLAFANPTQSLTVQDRSGVADGTASTSGVTQVQPVVQGNLTSLAVSSGTARTPADGAITAEDVLINTDTHFTTGGTPKVSINTTANALSFGFSDEIAYIRKHGSGAIFQWQTSDSGSNAGEIQLQPYGGNLLVGAADLNANVGAKKMQLEGSASTSVGPEMLLHNPAQGGGAASMLTFGGKASGTEGYTAAIKVTNTGTLTIGTSSASGGFSEPAADLTIASTGLCTFSDGIAFQSATTGSGTGTGYTLDKYEEGTFTATLRGVTEPATLVTTTACRYTRIGDRVHFSIGFENKNTTGYAGAISVDGLPFANNATIRSVVNVLPYNLGSWASGQATAIIYFSSTTISLYSIASASAWSTISHNAGTARYLWINGSYNV